MKIGLILLSNVDNSILLLAQDHKIYDCAYVNIDYTINSIEEISRLFEKRYKITPNNIISRPIEEGNKKYYIAYTNKKAEQGKGIKWLNIEEDATIVAGPVKSIVQDIKGKKVLILYKPRLGTAKKVISSPLQGSKHAYSRVLPLLLISEKIHFDNVPDILDVGIVDQVISLSKEKGDSIELPLSLTSRSRSIINLLAGLIYRHQKITLTKPLGCAIGERKIDLYLDILEKFGSKITHKKDRIIIERLKFKPINYSFFFPSFTGTSLAIIIASFITGRTTLSNISIEPEILYLIDILKELGVEINFIAEREIQIIGRDFHLKKNYHFEIPEDRNVLITRIVTGLIKEVAFEYKSKNKLYLASFLQILEKMGVNFEYNEYSIKIPKQKLSTLKPVEIHANFYPGFCSDWQPLIAPLLCQIQGKSIVTDSVFESRFNYIRELQKINRGFVSDVVGSVLEIQGGMSSNLTKNNHIECLDLRSGAANVIVALLSSEEVVIENIIQINRGYENILNDVSSVLGYSPFEYALG